MATKKKVNPRRIPLSQADLERTKHKVQEDATKFISLLMLTVLRDKFGFGRTRLDRAWDAVNDLADSVAKGYVSVADLEKTLLTEANIRLRP